MERYTAIVLSAKPVTLEIPGVVVHGFTQVLASASDLHAARLDALAAVQTPLCFFLDDDDALPGDYLSVLDACADRMRATGAALAYTDELVREPGKGDVRRCWYDYDSEAHRFAPMGLHHLVVMDTAVAREVAQTLPRGEFWTEHMLYWSMGRRGAAHVPSVGYVWNRSRAGFSRNPRMLAAQMRTQRWVATQGALA